MSAQNTSMVKVDNIFLCKNAEWRWQPPVMVITFPTWTNESPPVTLKYHLGDREYRHSCGDPDRTSDILWQCAGFDVIFPNEQELNKNIIHKNDGTFKVIMTVSSRHYILLNISHKIDNEDVINQEGTDTTYKPILHYHFLCNSWESHRTWLIR
jgi:hypothetical protein